MVCSWAMNNRARLFPGRSLEALDQPDGDPRALRARKQNADAVLIVAVSWKRPAGFELERADHGDLGPAASPYVFAWSNAAPILLASKTNPPAHACAAEA